MLADRYSRKAVLVWGTGVWGILTLLVGFATGYWQILALTVLSGIGLTARGGPQEALVADLFPREERGKAFGTIWSIASVGVVLSVLVLGILADVSEMGWRIAFLLFGGLSVLSGVIIWRYVDEPVRGQSEAAFVGVSSETVAKLEVQHPFSVSKIPDLFRVPTLVLDWLNTIPAQLRWVGIVRFGTVWLADDRGLSPGTALYALGSLTIGLGIGGFFGGRLGDWADRRVPRYGRLVLGQVALLVSVAASFLLLLVNWEEFWVYWIYFLIIGLSMQVTDSGAETPIRTSVVLPELRATALGVDGIVGGLTIVVAAYVVGQLGNSIGLTSTLIWAVIGGSTVYFLMWFAYYPVFQRDATKMQAVLSARQASLLAGETKGS